jgi:antitoxin HigA-1
MLSCLITWITTEKRGHIMMKNHPHPGELLREDVLLALGIEVTDAAQRLGMSRTALSRVINGRAGISPDLAIRLERAGVSTARFWMTLQSNYELAQAEQRVQPVVRLLQEGVV